MSDATTAAVRAELEEEREELRARLSDLGSLDYDENFADSSQVTAERGETEALASSLRERLHEVEAALEKIEDGTYGVCESCGQRIGEARLEAMPTASHCIECASRR